VVKSVIGVLAILAVCAGGYFYWFDDERQIARLLDDVAAAVSQEQPLGMAGMAEVAGMRTLLAPDVTIDSGAPSPGPIVDAPDVIAAVARLRSRFAVIQVSFVDVQVTLGQSETGAEAGRDTATVHTTARIHTRTASGDENVDAREVVLTVRRLGGRWVIAAVKPVSVLERVVRDRAPSVPDDQRIDAVQHGLEDAPAGV
jgi:hypothetical protein